jgi:hypothetical protein
MNLLIVRLLIRLLHRLHLLRPRLPLETSHPQEMNQPPPQGSSETNGGASHERKPTARPPR